MSTPLTPRHDAPALRRAALIAGIVYLLTDATSIFGIYVRSTLVVSGDATRTAANIAEHAQLFRAGVVADAVGGAALVVLNLALYQLLASVHRTLTRLAAWWWLIEIALGGAIAVFGFLVLSLLGGASYAQALAPRELHALVHLFVGAQESGYMILLLFFGLGSTIYAYLLFRSRYVPRPLALLGCIGSALVVVCTLVQMLFPAFAASAFAAVRTLPTFALVLLAVIVVPVLAFEILLGLWLVVKGVRLPEQA